MSKITIINMVMNMGLSMIITMTMEMKTMMKLLHNHRNRQTLINPKIKKKVSMRSNK